MLENHPLFLSVFACIAGVIIASWELVPQLNEIIQLAPFPPDGYYRYKVVSLVVATIFGTFLWDRLCTMVFAPHVFAGNNVTNNTVPINNVINTIMSRIHYYLPN